MFSHSSAKDDRWRPSSAISSIQQLPQYLTYDLKNIWVLFYQFTPLRFSSPFVRHFSTIGEQFSHFTSHWQVRQTCHMICPAEVDKSLEYFQPSFTWNWNWCLLTRWSVMVIIIDPLCFDIHIVWVVLNVTLYELGSDVLKCHVLAGQGSYPIFFTWCTQSHICYLNKFVSGSREPSLKISVVLKPDVFNENQINYCKTENQPPKMFKTNRSSL